MESLKTLQQVIDLRAKELNKLVDTLQDTIRVLARRGYKLYDESNEEYYLNGEIYFDKEDMKFKLEFDKED